jgi:predicted membrane protein
MKPLESQGSLGAAMTPQFIFGVLVMLVGGALLLDTFDVVDSSRVFRLWPLAVVAFGVMHFTRGASEHRFWGVFWILTGCWLLLRTLGVWNVGFWELFLPILLIGAGVSLVLRTLSEGGYVKPETNKAAHLFAVMGGSTRKYDGQPFEGAYLTAVMGGCALDLRRAMLKPGEERAVTVFALMGGHEIKVPPDWDVVVKVVPIMGGVEDKRTPSVAPPVPGASAAPPRLIIQGTVMMGGLELKN